MLQEGEMRTTPRQLKGMHLGAASQLQLIIYFHQLIELVRCMSAHLLSHAMFIIFGEELSLLTADIASGLSLCGATL